MPSISCQTSVSLEGMKEYFCWRATSNISQMLLMSLISRVIASHSTSKAKVYTVVTAIVGQQALVGIIHIGHDIMIHIGEFT